MALKHKCPTLKKVGKDEEIFVVRAQDVTAPKTVALWIVENIYTAPADKLIEALECAIKMRNHPRCKRAD